MEYKHAERHSSFLYFPSHHCSSVLFFVAVLVQIRCCAFRSSRLHICMCAVSINTPNIIHQLFLQLYRALVQSRSCNVKQTLACSLHEVARILSTSEEVPEPLENLDENSNEFFLAGVSLVERELIPIFECMLQVRTHTVHYCNCHDFFLLHLALF